MLDIKTRKSLFKDYSNVKWMEVNKNGKIISVDDVIVDYVAVDKKGNVSIDFALKNEPDKTMVVDVDDVTFNDAVKHSIQGLFTSKEKAIAVVKEWFSEM